MSYYDNRFYTEPGTKVFFDNKPQTLKRDCAINEVGIMEQDEWFDDLEMFKRLGFVDAKGYIILPKGTTITLLPREEWQRGIRSFSINGNPENQFSVNLETGVPGLLADAVLDTPEIGDGYFAD